jgi:hypothetical protein
LIEVVGINRYSKAKSNIQILTYKSSKYKTQVQNERKKLFKYRFLKRENNGINTSISA